MRTCSGRPDRDDAARFEAVDAVADSHDHGHVVLDHEHAGVEFVADALDERHERFALALRDARGRLVEAEHPRARGHQARELDDAPRPRRQLVHELVAEAAEAEEVDDLVGLGAGRALPAGHSVHRQADGVAHAQVGEELRALERSTEPEAGASRRREAARAAAEDLDLAPAGDEAADRVHQRRLARAVGADESDDLARCHVQVDLVDDGAGAEANGHLADARAPCRAPRGAGVVATETVVGRGRRASVVSGSGARRRASTAKTASRAL